MKNFVLKMEFIEELVASLNVKCLHLSEKEEAFPLINAWVKDMTQGELFLTIGENGYFIKTFKDTPNFKVRLEEDFINIYKLKKVSFIKEIK